MSQRKRVSTDIQEELMVAEEVAPQRPTVKRNQSRMMSLAFVGVLLFVLIYCARPTDWIDGIIPGAGKIPYQKIAGFLALAGFLLASTRIRQRLPREVIYLVLLLVQLSLAVIFSPVWRGGAFDNTLAFSKVVLITLVMSLTVTSVSRLRRLIFVETAAVALIAGLAILQGKFSSGRLEGVGYGAFENPNDLGLAIALNFPFAFAFLLRTRKSLRKVIWAAVLVVMTYALLLTVSRGSLVELTVAAGVCLWEFGVRGRRRHVLILAGIIGLGLFISSGAQLGGRFKAIFISQKDRLAYSSSEARQQLLWHSLQITAEHPIFGIGPGNFAIVSGNWHVTHNSYTQMSSEGGLPALFLYVLILWRAFANIREAKRLARGQTEKLLLAGALRASLGALVVGSFFTSAAYQFFPYFLVAYSTALIHVASLNNSSLTRAIETDRELRVVEGSYEEISKTQASWTV